MKRIVISGWYGFKNTGDEAILASMINSISKEIKDVDITVFSNNPAYTTRIHHVKALYQLPFGILSVGSAILRARFFQTIKVLWNADLFILGGGGFLSDWQSWTVILQWLEQAVLAKKIFGKKLMLYAVGAGPITTKIGKFLTRTILNRCADIITVRDGKSKEWLYEAGVKKEIYITADPAIQLKPAKPERISEILREEGIDGSKPSIGLAVSPIFHIQKYWPDQQEKFLKFKSVWPRVINFITSELDVDAVFIPMQVSIDRDFALDLIKNIKNKDRVKVITGEYTPQETMGIISRMDMIVGMRFHSLILAAEMGVPTVGIIYLHKSEYFLREINQENFAIDVGDGVLWKNADIDLEKLTKNIRDVWLKRDRLGKEIIENVTELKGKELLNAKLACSLLGSNK